jgi:hypothetical protein
MPTPRVALLFLLLLPMTAAAGSHSGHEGPIRTLVAGIEGHMLIATAWLHVDPLTDPHPIPARAQDSSWTGHDVLRFVRIYFPRTYEDLLEFEYMILACIEVWVFSGRQQRMLHDSIREAGLGGMQERSVMSMHGIISGPWADSILSDAFPNDADAVVSMDYTLHSDPMRVVINANPNVPPVLKPYKNLPGVEYSFGPGYGTNLAIPKEGAVITSYSVGPYQYGFPGAYPDPEYGGKGWIPHSMYWAYGEGITWTHQDMFGRYWNTLYNPYAPDMILAEIIYSTGRELPEDVVLLHRLRLKFAEYASARSFIYALLDFIDKFGANTDAVVARISEMTETTDLSRRAYLAQEYDSASRLMEQALAEIELVRKEALATKDRALLWIYVIEWLAVSGVFLIAAFSLWTLMVKRRLYREVSVTRLSTSEE